MRDLIVLRFIRRHGVLLKQIGILWFTCRCITTVFPQRDMCSAIFMSCAVYYFQLHRYGVPLLQCCVVHPGTSLWRFPETDMYFAVILCHMCCRLFQGTSLCCSCLSVLCCTSRYIAMVFLFISTVLYFQVYRYGVPVYQYLLCCTSRYFAMVLPSNRQVFGSMSCITSRYIVYGVPVHQYGVVLPGTSLWCSCS